ncbi:MAG: hypothetical protein DRH50_06780 [Deltaproteobacteria bacterium]|nr:MAG: hypothetical protein DRH50_06780 [Deltaproteobacteria bacterium]
MHDKPPLTYLRPGFTEKLRLAIARRPPNSLCQSHTSNKVAISPLAEAMPLPETMFSSYFRSLRFGQFPDTRPVHTESE